VVTRVIGPTNAGLNHEIDGIGCEHRVHFVSVSTEPPAEYGCHYREWRSGGKSIDLRVRETQAEFQTTYQLR
jgi:hypothetical protein